MSSTRQKINLVFVLPIVFAAFVCASGVAVGATVTDPEDLWTSEDIVQLDVMVSDGMLTVQVTERNSLDDFSSHFIEIFLDTDQDHNTGDARVGGVRGTDYRIGCISGIINTSDLYQLPTEDGGAEQITPFSDIPDASASVDGNILTVELPVNVLGGTAAVDVFAVAHKGGNPYAIVGNGDRCPEAGALDTSTGEVVVRRPGVPLDVTFSDLEGDNQKGQDLTAARFRTFGDQFQIILTFADPINPLDLSYDLSGSVIMDSDRNLLTGFYGMGNEIPTWGGDVILSFTVCYLTPMFDLAFGIGSGKPLLIGPRFGPPSSDGRWFVQGNQLIMTGSLSIFDARALTVSGGNWGVERRPTDGRMITTVHTFDYLKMADSMPERGCAFDTGTRQVLDPFVWDPDATISGVDPEEFGGISGMDLIQVDVGVVKSNLVVKGILSKWDATQVGNLFEILLDTDMNSTTGELVSNDQTPGQPAIGTDYKIRVYSRDEYTFVGYYADLVRSDGVIEPHDAILFANPSSLGPASFTVTIPLEAIGNPATELRLFVTTGWWENGKFGRYDVAPPYPINVKTAADTIPPASITNLHNTTYEQTYIIWTWNDPADADFSHVMVYINGAFKTNVTNGIQQYNATGLAPDTEYEIGTHTVDDAGNINTTWVNHIARTKPKEGLKGDFNGDGDVDWDDFLKFADAYGSATGDPNYNSVGDFDNDGDIDWDDFLEFADAYGV